MWSGAQVDNLLLDFADADLLIAGAGGERFGEALAGGGDLDGDGVQDLLIAASDADTGASQLTGRVYIAPAGSLGGTLTQTQEFNSGDLEHRLCGSAVGERLGMSAEVLASRALAIVPDVNGDGLDDLLVGAPNWRGPNDEHLMGRVYLVLSRFEAGE